MEFRALTAEEVECRVAQVGRPKGEDPIPWITALLYKNARCDMAILDETVGPLNWQRHHSRENANCILSIWDEEKKQWIEKEDTGTESNTEAEKGLASDSFKRAATNWGIGRELYTAPMIYIPHRDKDGKENYAVKEFNGKVAPDIRLAVTCMVVRDGRIVGLNIENTKKRRTVFAWGEIL